MSKIRLHGTSSGYTDIAPTAAAGNNTLTAPTGTGTLVAQDAAGAIGITSVHSAKGEFTGNVTVGDTLYLADQVVHTGDTNTKIRFPTNDNITVETAGTERLRIDSNGVICVKHTNALHSGNLQVATSGSDAIDINAYSSTAANGGRLTFYRSKNASIGSNTIVTDNDSLGRIDFRGYNSSGNAYNIGATIEAEVDGSVDSATDMPSALTFKTSADGSSSPTERLRIKSDGDITAVGIVTAQAFVPTKIQTSHKNIIINGAMQVAQRGTSNTTQDQGYRTVDRFTVSWSGLDSVIEQHQGTLSSSDGTPYNLGFRNTWKLVNGDQTGGAGASDYIQAEYRIEAQDIATSGWHYKSDSSYITLSFWLKTSVSQNFTINLTTFDGTGQRIPMKTGTIAANTWTKITKTVPGNSNIDINNDRGKGMSIMFYPYLGNSYVGGSTLNVWSNSAVSNFGGSNESSWYTTNDATFEVTGFQLEVGEVATPFEFRSYAEEHLRCARYYQEQSGGSDVFMYAAKAQGTTSADIGVGLVVPMRGTPSVTCSAHRLFHSDGVGYSSSSTAPTVVQWDNNHSIHSATIGINAGGHSGITNNECCTWSPSSASLLFDAEL